MPAPTGCDAASITAEPPLSQAALSPRPSWPAAIASGTRHTAGGSCEVPSLRTAATVGLSAAVCAVAAPAQAADVSITLPGLVVSAADPFVVSGRCPAGTDSAVVDVEEGALGVGGGVVDVASNGSWRIAIDITEGGTSQASVFAGCYEYGNGMPLAASYRPFHIVAPGRTAVDVPVTVSPSRVPLGGTLHVTATCQPGATEAWIGATRGDGHVPFSHAKAVPDSDGTVTAELPVTVHGDDWRVYATSQTGPGIVFVHCDTSTRTRVAGIGLARFTITAAPAAAPVPGAGDRPASATPQLANTGSDAASMTALAASLVLAGAGAHLLRRRLVRA